MRITLDSPLGRYLPIITYQKNTQLRAFFFNQTALKKLSQILSLFCRKIAKIYVYGQIRIYI